jgi:hypothetical protein
MSFTLESSGRDDLYVLKRNYEAFCTACFRVLVWGPMYYCPTCSLHICDVCARANLRVQPCCEQE